MNFHPTKLPAPMQAVWMQGPSYWRELALAAAHVGLYDIDYVTSAVFYLRHPERGYRRIEASETGLVQEWKALRVTVDTILRSRPRNAAARVNVHDVSVMKITDGA